MSRRRLRFRKPSLWRRILSNRRDTHSSRVSIADVTRNIREELFSFFQRVPRGARLYWDGKSKIKGYSTRRRY